MENMVMLTRKEYDVLMNKVKYIDELQNLDDKYVLLQDFGLKLDGVMPKVITNNKEEIILDVLRQIEIVNNKYQEVLDAYKEYNTQKEEGFIDKVLNKFKN